MHSRILRWALAALCAGAAAAGWQLFRILALEIQGSIQSDVQLYLIVGRGILNGLTPYVDLYESKPPGMFLLSALSLALTDGEALMAWIATLLLVAVPLGIGAFAWRNGQTNDAASRLFVTLAALLTGILLSLYAEEKGGMLQTELFGGLLGALYALSVAWRRGKETPGSMFLHGILLMLILGLKETFLPIAIAAAAILCKDRLHFVRAFLVPLGVAAALGAILLALAGMLIPYLTIDLPSMLLRSGAGYEEPLWLRALSIRRLYAELLPYATSPLFGATLILLWCLRLQPPAGNRWKTPVLAALLGALLLASIHALYAVLSHAVARNLGGGSIVALVVWLSALLVLTAVLIVFLRTPDGQRLFPQIPVAVLSLLLLSSAVGIGGYGGYHYAGAVPVYAALLLWSIPHGERLGMIVAPFVVIAALLYAPSDGHLRTLRDGRMLNFASQRPFVEQFDGMLDACSLDRYFVVGNYERFAFAKHSPIGPLFAPQNYQFFLPEDHPLVQQTKANLLTKNPIFVVSSGTEIDGAFSALLLQRYTQTPPPCAKDFLPLQDALVFFPNVLP